MGKAGLGGGHAAVRGAMRQRGGRQQAETAPCVRPPGHDVLQARDLGGAQVRGVEVQGGQQHESGCIERRDCACVCTCVCVCVCVCM